MRAGYSVVGASLWRLAPGTFWLQVLQDFCLLSDLERPCVLLRTTESWVEVKGRQTRIWLFRACCHQNECNHLEPPSNSLKSRANKQEWNQMKSKNNGHKPVSPSESPRPAWVTDKGTQLRHLVNFSDFFSFPVFTSYNSSRSIGFTPKHPQVVSSLHRYCRCPASGSVVFCLDYSKYTSSLVSLTGFMRKQHTQTKLRILPGLGQCAGSVWAHANAEQLFSPHVGGTGDQDVFHSGSVWGSDSQFQNWNKGAHRSAFSGNLFFPFQIPWVVHKFVKVISWIMRVHEKHTIIRWTKSDDDCLCCSSHHSQGPVGNLNAHSSGGFQVHGSNSSNEVMNLGRKWSRGGRPSSGLEGEPSGASWKPAAPGPDLETPQQDHPPQCWFSSR